MVPKYFSRDCSTGIISCSERKKTEENKIKTRQQIKKGRSKRCCRCQSTWLIIAPLSHCYRSAVAPLLHHYRSSVSPPLSLRCCAAVAPLSHRYCSTVALLLLLLLSLRSRTTIALLSRHCRSAAVAAAVATQSLRSYACSIRVIAVRLLSDSSSDRSRATVAR